MSVEPDPGALSHVLPRSRIELFQLSDLAELVVLQRCCWVQEAIINQTLEVPALHETFDEVAAWAQSWTCLVTRLDHRLVAAVRGRVEGTQWQVGRLMVAPDLPGRGIGSALLSEIERLAPTSVTTYIVFTGGASERNIGFYERAGYTLSPSLDPPVPGHIRGAVCLTKRRSGWTDGS
jgi:GNAT superfamily N-acetyltransferase